MDQVTRVIQNFNDLSLMSRDLFSEDNGVIHVEIERTLNNTIKFFLSSYIQSFSEYLAKFCDNCLLLRSGNNTEKLADIIKVHSLISDKDNFMEHYKKFLGFRLLQNKVVSYEAENQFLD